MISRFTTTCMHSDAAISARSRLSAAEMIIVGFRAGEARSGRVQILRLESGEIRSHTSVEGFVVIGVDGVYNASRIERVIVVALQVRLLSKRGNCDCENWCSQSRTGWLKKRSEYTYCV